MVIYLITFCVVAGILVVSYRALGGEVATDDDIAVFMTKVNEWVRTDIGRLAFIATPDVLSESDVEVARDVRKKLSGYQQQLNRLAATEDERSQVGRAIEAAGWACRMVETGSYRLNEGVRAAAKDLYAYASELAGGLPAATSAEPSLSEIVDGAGDSLIK